MIRTIGLIEFNSIAEGIKTADVMIKAAEVDLIFSKPICPGKYLVLIAGDVGAVKSSVQSGLETGGRFVVDKLVLSRVHPQLINAINATTDIEGVAAVGVLEYFSVATALVGADTAAKAAQVDLIEVRLGVGVGGKSFVTLTGNISATEQAVAAGAQVGEENGLLVSKVVIPSPRKELFYNLL